ncbi:MAG: hypothetical protein WDO19_22865 [Bacteroidota bacterium]
MGGDISGLSVVHNAHPDRDIYFTEQWVGAPGPFPEYLNAHVKLLIIGATRNWSRMYWSGTWLLTKIMVRIHPGVARPV